MKTRSILITFFIYLTTVNMSCQNPELTKDTDYKNLIRNIELAEKYVGKGDTRNAEKRISYANKFSKKLIEKGYEKDIAKEISSINHLVEKNASPKKDTKSKVVLKNASSSINSSQFRTEIAQMEDLNNKLTSLLKLPFSNMYMSDYSREDLEQFDRVATLQEIEKIRNYDIAKKAHNKRHLSTLDELEALVQDWDNSIEKNKVFDKIDEALKDAKKYPSREKIRLENTLIYIELLLLTSPNHQKMKQYFDKVKSLIDNFKEQTNTTTNSQKSQDNPKKELPVAGMNDSKLETEFVELAKEFFPYKYKVLQAIITSSEWGINKDNLGRTMSRTITTAIVIKANDGQCYYQHIVFYQNANGNSYGKTVLDRSWSSKQKHPIDCEL